MIFEQLVWLKDRALLGDLVFRLEHYKSDDWNLGDSCFSFYKIKPLVDQYARSWSLRHNFRPEGILELGIWDGGSIAFWFEHFQPNRLVGIDISKRGDSRYFEHYIASRGIAGRVKTYWGVNQGDAARLKRIVAEVFADGLSLVIDDASHTYELTKASFEALFPLLRPGGLYVIEDWAWAHWPPSKYPAPGPHH